MGKWRGENAKKLRELEDAVEQALHPTSDGSVGMIQDSGNVVLQTPPDGRILVQITGGSNPYSWTSIQPIIGGKYNTDTAGLLHGFAAGPWPAYERNSNTNVPIGTYAILDPEYLDVGGADQEWSFDYGAGILPVPAILADVLVPVDSAPGVPVTTTLYVTDLSEFEVTSQLVTDASTFPLPGPFLVQIDAEVIGVAKAGKFLFEDLTRGVNGTAVASHAVGATVTLVQAGPLPPSGISPTLTADIGTAESSISVSDTSVFPWSTGFFIQVDGEVMQVTLITPGAPGDFVVTRGQDSTTPADHGSGAYVFLQGQYGWIEQVPTKNRSGLWTPKVGGRTGTQLNQPAFERNHSTRISLGTYVLLWQRYVDCQLASDVPYQVLNNDYAPTDTTWVIRDGTNLPKSFPYYLRCEGEFVEVTAVVSVSILTVVRGQYGSQAMTHTAGTQVLVEVCEWVFDTTVPEPASSTPPIPPTQTCCGTIQVVNGAYTLLDTDDCRQIYFSDQVNQVEAVIFSDSEDVSTTLTASLTAGATTVLVSGFAGFPSSIPYLVRIDEEQILVTAGQGTTTWTVTRGANGTTPESHLNDAIVTLQDMATGEPVTDLAAPLDDVATSCTVSAASDFADGSYFQTGDEIMLLVSGAGTTSWTITRGQLGTDPDEHDQTVVPVTTLNGSITSGAGTMVVASATHFPATNINPFYVWVDSELIEVTAGAGTTSWTINRGLYGTTAAAHSNGVNVTLAYVLFAPAPSDPFQDGWCAQIVDGSTQPVYVIPTGGGAVDNLSSVTLMPRDSIDLRSAGDAANWESARGRSARGVTPVSTSTYTLLYTDNGKVVECSHSGKVTVSLPASGLPNGFSCTLRADTSDTTTYIQFQKLNTDLTQFDYIANGEAYTWRVPDDPDDTDTNSVAITSWVITPTSSQNSNYAITPADHGRLLLCTAVLTVTLPTANTALARLNFPVVNQSTALVTVAVPGGVDIDGVLNGTLTLFPGQSAVIRNDGTNYFSEPGNFKRLVKQISATTYTVLLSDRDKLLRCTGSSNIAITLPQFAAGWNVDIENECVPGSLKLVTVTDAASNPYYVGPFRGYSFFSDGSTAIRCQAGSPLTVCSPEPGLTYNITNKDHHGLLSYTAESTASWTLDSSTLLPNFTVSVASRVDSTALITITPPMGVDIDGQDSVILKLFPFQGIDIYSDGVGYYTQNGRWYEGYNEQTITNYVFELNDNSTIIVYTGLATATAWAMPLMPLGWWCDFHNFSDYAVLITDAGGQTAWFRPGEGTRFVSNGTTFIQEMPGRTFHGVTVITNAAATINASAKHSLIYFQLSTLDRVATLDVTTQEPNFSVYIENSFASSYNVTVAPAAGTIDGVASIVLFRGTGILINCDGTNYWTQRGYQPELSNIQSGTTYTFTASDYSRLVVYEGNTATQWGVPQMPAGWWCDVHNDAIPSATTARDLLLTDVAGNFFYLRPGEGTHLVSDGSTTIGEQPGRTHYGVQYFTSATTLYNADRGILNFVLAASGALVVDLHAQTLFSDFGTYVQNSPNSIANVLVRPSGTATINDLYTHASPLILAPCQGVWIASDGTNYYTDNGACCGPDMKVMADAGAAMKYPQNAAVTSVPFTASRALTLDAAAAYAVGTTISVADLVGAVTSVNTLVITSAGGDLIDGLGTLTLNTAYSTAVLQTNGVSKWGILSVLPVPATQGGTGIESATAHGIILGNGTGAFNVTAVGTNGQLLVGQTTADPLWKTASGSGATITVSSSGVFTISAIANASLSNSTITVGATSTALGGTLAAATGRGSSGLNIDQMTTHGDSNYAILATDRTVATSATLTAPRTWTLPAANAVNAGQAIVVEDQAGGVGATNTLTVSRAGADTINGGTTAVLSLAYSGMVLYSDGVSQWTHFNLAGSGTVTSVGASGPTGFLTWSGSPVTNSGSLVATLNSQSANTVLAGPVSGGAATPTVRALVAGDLPAGTGTVTSVSAAGPTGIFTWSAAVTGSGTLTATASNQNANFFYAGPTTGGASTPLFRAIVAADVGLTTKGDLLTYSTSIARLGVGSDGFVLIADSSQATGLKWGAAPAGTAAVKADEIAGTSTTLFTNPGVQQFHSSAAKAWGTFNMVADTHGDFYGISSITDNGTGDATINWTTNFTDTAYTVVSQSTEFSSPVSFAVGSHRINYFAFSGIQTDPSIASVAAFGTQ